jgi:hypothetical protein
MLPLKDEMLRRLAEHANVAQFLSFGPGQGTVALGHGAAVPGHDGGLVVEGVAGVGDDFMLARAAPARLPDRVLDDVRRVGARAADALGPVRFEWAHDGDQAWVLQLHLAEAAVASATTIHPGTTPATCSAGRRSPRGWSDVSRITIKS